MDDGPHLIGPLVAVDLNILSPHMGAGRYCKSKFFERPLFLALTKSKEVRQEAGDTPEEAAN